MVTIKKESKKRKGSVTLEVYLAGQSPFIELEEVRLYGEDIENDIMLISIHDLPGWIKSGWRFKLKMPEDDIKLLKDYFSKI